MVQGELLVRRTKVKTYFCPDEGFPGIAGKARRFQAERAGKKQEKAESRNDNYNNTNAELQILT
ncbi:MAG: hypothetical protein H0T80_05475 [Betaproteobacteria bacterium]|nr:hypothetical protein [Betaproteobacteria bacterium]